MLTSGWFSVMKQSLDHAKTVTGKLSLYCSTPIPPLHWNALGARRLPCKVSVWTAWHTTSSKWGIFLEVSSFLCISFLLLRSFGHGLGNHNHTVFGMNSQSFFCPCSGFDVFSTHLVRHLMKSAQTFDRRPPSISVLQFHQMAGLTPDSDSSSLLHFLK